MVQIKLREAKFICVIFLSVSLISVLNALKIRKKCPYRRIHDHEHDLPQCGVAPAHCSEMSWYYRTFDGSCNNLMYPSFGMARTRYTRIKIPKYADTYNSAPTSVYGTPLPNPRELSLQIFGEVSIPDSKLNVLSLQWGQMVAHDISELFQKNEDRGKKMKSEDQSIPMPLYDPIRQGTGKHLMSFKRALTDKDASCLPSGLPHLEKMTMCTSYLDLSPIYGNTVQQSEKVRAFQNGLLLTRSKGGIESLLVDEIKKAFIVSDKRNLITPPMTALHILLVREHNRIANRIQFTNPDLNDEHIFQEARKINIAKYQYITYYEWLPLHLGKSYMLQNNIISDTSSYYYDNYDINMDPSAISAFSAVAFRYSHHQVPGYFTMFSNYLQHNHTFRLSTYFDQPLSTNFLEYKDNLRSVIQGMVMQPRKKADSNINVELKHNFMRKWHEEFGTDLRAIDIQRGRDFGIASYNDFRELCGLKRAYIWNDFESELSHEAIAKLAKHYSAPDDVDLSIGGAMEKHAPESEFGPTFRFIIGEQFRRLRIGDRFFFERAHNIGFTEEQIADIRKSTVSKLLCNNEPGLDLYLQKGFEITSEGNTLTQCRED